MRVIDALFRSERERTLGGRRAGLSPGDSIISPSRLPERASATAYTKSLSRARRDRCMPRPARPRGDRASFATAGSVRHGRPQGHRDRQTHRSPPAPRRPSCPPSCSPSSRACPGGRAPPLMKATKAAVVPGLGLDPRGTILSRNSADLTAASSSLLIRSTIAGGVPFGAKSPAQWPITHAGKTLLPRGRQRIVGADPLAVRGRDRLELARLHLRQHDDARLRRRVTRC